MKKGADRIRISKTTSEFIGRIEARSQPRASSPTILRSASSGPAQASILKARDLALTGIAAKAGRRAFSDPGGRCPSVPMPAFRSCKPRGPQPPADPLGAQIRVCSLFMTSDLRQLALLVGRLHARRDADKRNALSLVEDAAAGTLRLGHLAFKARGRRQQSSPRGGDSGRNRKALRRL